MKNKIGWENDMRKLREDFLKTLDSVPMSLSPPVKLVSRTLFILLFLLVSACSTTIQSKEISSGNVNAD